MKVAVLQSNYIPWKGNFDLIKMADQYIFYDEVQYTKNDWRNRNRIYSKNGLQWLTIPIPKNAVNLKISEVVIEDKNWQQKHYKSICNAYQRAPCFYQIESLLKESYIGNQWKYLIDVNRYLMKKISEMIGIETCFSDSKDYVLEGNKVEKLLNLLKQVKANEYISGPSGKNYIDPFRHLFEENNIKLTYMDYSKYTPYTQLKQPFVHEVSIIDMMVNMPLEDIKSFI